VLHVTGYFYPATEWGGPARSVPALTAALAAEGVDVRVITTTSRGAPGLPPLKPGVRLVGGCEVEYLEARGPRRYFFSPAMKSAIERALVAADVVHITGMWTYPVAIAGSQCRRVGRPYVISPRGSLDPWALAQGGLKKRIYMKLLEEGNLRTASGVHFTARNEATKALMGLSGLKAFVVANPVPILEPVPVTRNPNSSRTILALGRLHRMKGFDVLLPAFESVAAHCPDVVLVIAGPEEDGYGTELRAEVSARGLTGRVRFTGMVGEAERARLFAEAGCLVAPSLRENFGMAIAEAMQAGLPVVISKEVDIAPRVESAGAGLVVERRPEAVAFALERLLGNADLARSMGERGRELVQRLCSPSSVGRRMVKAYEAASRGELHGNMIRDFDAEESAEVDDD